MAIDEKAFEAAMNRLEQAEKKLLALEDTFAKTHDPKAKEQIAELRGIIEALTKKLEKAGAPAAPAAPAAAPAAPAAPATPKRKTIDEEVWGK